MAIHIHLVRKSKDAVASAKIKAHSQFTQGDYDYLKGKGWSDAEILKRWDEEARGGSKPQQTNKNAKSGAPGYASAFKDSVASCEADIAKQQRLIDVAKKAGKDVPGQVMQRMAFLKEELEKAKAKTEDDEETIALWKGDTTSGLWRHQRNCLLSESEKWLKIFQSDDPKNVYKLSKNKPSGIPRK